MNTSDESTNEPVNVLIAEDSPTQAERLRHSLEGHGYQVTVTMNGRQALEAIKSREPALIVSDVVMPEMDGYEFCKSVKSDASLQHIPVILLTTLSNPDDVIRGLECLADNFIIKPYDVDYLLSRVEYVIINQRMRSQDRVGVGVEIFFGGNRHFITADRLQILNLLLSTYEAAIQKNRELLRVRDDLREANLALEDANKELESFGYSVSHDLRAPLRAIDGFSAILAEDCRDKLNENDKKILGTIRNGAQNMGRLIDDLLAFSRLGRKELETETVDMIGLASEVVGELSASGRDTKRFKIGPLPPARGDRALLRQVLTNLLSNAAKYSEKVESPVIEMSGRAENGENIYYVKDNGVGFDMTYCNKLFGVFQRLHSDADFEGTGVGLAIVKRVIHRHGGRVWAEAAINEGATFYFTLPMEPETRTEVTVTSTSELNRP